MQALGAALERATGVAAATIKLIEKGKKALVLAQHAPGATTDSVGACWCAGLAARAAARVQ